MGNIDAPFFGAPKKEKRGERRKRTPFFVASSIGLVGLWVCRALGFADAASAIDAAEVVKGAAFPPASETWRAAVREAVYTLREKGLVQYVWEAEVVN